MPQLNYAAQLRMPAKSTRSERNAMVDAVLKDLGLTKQADLVVGRLFKKHISGGQKRRLFVFNFLSNRTDC